MEIYKISRPCKLLQKKSLTACKSAKLMRCGSVSGGFSIPFLQVQIFQHFVHRFGATAIRTKALNIWTICLIEVEDRSLRGYAKLFPPVQSIKQWRKIATNSPNFLWQKNIFTAASVSNICLRLQIIINFFSFYLIIDTGAQKRLAKKPTIYRDRIRTYGLCFQMKV